MHLSDTALGYIAVAGAILFFGSFAVPLKTKKVQEAKVDPVIFQLYYSVSIFVSSWLVLTYVPFVFTYFGIIGAALWVPASILSIVAINHLGMSIAVGVWCGVTVLTSFLWGAIAFSKEEKLRSLPLAILALFLLILGIVGLSFSNTDFVKNAGKKQKGYSRINDEETSLKNGERKYSSETDAQKNHKAPEQSAQRKPIIGFICALILGLMNGSMMVPLRYTPKEAQGINYIVSFAIGVLIVTPICAIVYFLVRRKKPEFHFRVAVIPGLITGLLWNLGNFFSIYATLYLGLTIGFPLTQTCLVVSGLWGMLVYKELSGARTIILWIISVIVLLAGATLLALFA